MISTLYITTTSESIIQLADATHISRNFTVKEFANNLGDKSKPIYLLSPHSQRFNEVAQRFRDLYKNSIDPTSGYRQPEYNKKVGGDPNSLHLSACAMDFIDKAKKDPYYVLSLYMGVLFQSGEIGAINLYNEGNYRRYHIEALSDIYLGYNRNHIRVYTNKVEYKQLQDYFTPMGIMVDYHGKK